MKEGQFILCGSGGAVTGNLNDLPTLEQIAAIAKTDDPKLYREMRRRGWLDERKHTKGEPNAGD